MPPNDRQIIRIRIRDLRRERDVTQEELADALGISRQSINAMEAGRSLPSLPIALQIASYFSVPLTHIFTIDEDGVVESIADQLSGATRERNASTTQQWSPLREVLDDIMQDRKLLSASSPSTPPSNIAQTEKEIYLEFRLPGYKKEDLSIEVGEDFLTVSGEVAETEEGEKHYVHREFMHASFTRTISLPAPVQTDTAAAEMKNGVLTIRLEKISENKPKTKKLEIKAE
jgi:HSP20 family protein